MRKFGVSASDVMAYAVSSPDGRWIAHFDRDEAWTGHRLVLRSMSDWSQAASIEVELKGSSLLVFSPDSKLIAVGRFTSGWRPFSAPDLTLVTEIPMPIPYSFSFAGDGSHVFAGGGKSGVLLEGEAAYLN